MTGKQIVIIVAFAFFSAVTAVAIMRIFGFEGASVVGGGVAGGVAGALAGSFASKKA